MGEIDGEVKISESPNFASDNALFDASQYEFFGKDVLEEVELGGLEADGDDAALAEFYAKNYHFFPHTDREEGESIRLLSDVDDLSSTFTKLTRTVSEPQGAGTFHGKGSFSRGSSLTASWAHERDFSNWVDQNRLDEENVHDSKRWSSQPYSFSPESKPLHRTSSYPQQPYPHQPQNITKPFFIPNSSFTSYPQESFSAPNLFPFSLPHHFASGLLHGQQFTGGNTSHFSYLGLSMNIRQPNLSHWLNQSGLHDSNGLMHHKLHQMPPSLSHLSNLQPQLYGISELRDQKVMRPSRRGGIQNPRFPQFRSKYMSVEEIDNILRIQLVATQSNDPYIDDYYHQACVAKKNSLLNSRTMNYFCPTSIIFNLPSCTKANSEPHAYLQVDALGRLPFSSIRRPRPLLEVDPPSNSGDNRSLNKNSVVKTLEQEPMLAARITVEDGLCLLLTVDDIDRLLQFSQSPDGGVKLRRQRQSLLEELAASLQLVDPLGPAIAPKDDLVFLRIVSIPKGRKLVSRFLKLLHLGDDDKLARIVSMAIFRHLRFLFGEMPSDLTAAKTTRNLAVSVTSIVSRMDLVALSLCLAAVVCSSEHPPLRPIGSSSGDGASISVKSVLERATELLEDQQVAANCTNQKRDLWQKSFNAFFGLLIKYCISKYEGIIESLVTATPNAAPIIGPDVASAITREMPMELLRASSPHTDEIQKKLLLDFGQRLIPVTGYTASRSSNGSATSESVAS